MNKLTKQQKKEIDKLLPHNTGKILDMLLNSKPTTKGTSPVNTPAKKVMEQKFKYDIKSGYVIDVDG